MRQFYRFQIGTLLTFGIILLLFVTMVQCTSVNSTSNRTASKPSFSTRFNALFVIDDLIAGEEEKMQQRLIFHPEVPLLEIPQYNYSNTTIDSIQQKVFRLLPRVDDERLRADLYTKLGISYFFRSDYYTALAYFDLAKSDYTTFTTLYYALRSRNLLNKSQEVRSLLNSISRHTFLNKERALLSLIYAESYAIEGRSDSAIHYTLLALNEGVPKKYIPNVQYNLARWYRNVGHNVEAIKYFKKLSQNLMTPAVIKLQSEIQILQIQPTDSSVISNYIKLLHKGYTDGQEDVVYTAIARDFRSLNIDSSVYYYQKIIEDSPSDSFLQMQAYEALIDLFQTSGDEAKAQEYNIVLSAKKTKGNSVALYPNSSTSANPSLGDDGYFTPAVVENQQQHFWEEYDKLYELYSSKHYDRLIQKADSLLNIDKQYMDKSKIALLRAFAVGYSQRVDSLVSALELLISKYGNNGALVKKARNYLNYIEDNTSLFALRNKALEADFSESYIDEYPEVIRNEKNEVINYIPELDSIAITERDEPYYFVIWVENPQVNLAPSRYALGQFIRTRYKHLSLLHELISLDNQGQVITVGVFFNLEEVKNFGNRIMDLLPEIMKVREKKYSTFVIPKKELEEIQIRGSLVEYIRERIK